MVSFHQWSNFQPMRGGHFYSSSICPNPESRGNSKQKATAPAAWFLPPWWVQSNLNQPITGTSFHWRKKHCWLKSWGLIKKSFASQISVLPRCPGNIPAKSVKNPSSVNIKEMKQNSQSSFSQHGQVQDSLFYLKASTVCPVPLVNKTSREMWK